MTRVTEERAVRFASSTVSASADGNATKPAAVSFGFEIKVSRPVEAAGEQEFVQEL